MIQRVQTVYLLISTLLVGLLFAFPVSMVEGGSQSSIVLVGIIAVVLLHVLAILGYKNRVRQVKFVLLAIIATLILFLIQVYPVYFSSTGANAGLQIGAVLPLIALVFDYLAIRSIKKDEALIRSIDRIR